MKQIQNKTQPEEQHKIISATTISSSPFPLPEELKQYNEINPELVDRVFRYTETNSVQRWEMENKTIDAIHKENMTELKQRGSN